jgi:prepilin-type N-terminal cleavage/methylation domain-containing protein
VAHRLPGLTARRLPAFTLIEVIVSIALSLVLILGVNAVFRMASDTVNVGQAVAVADRDNRALQSVLYEDVRTAVMEGAPYFVISSQRTPAFRDPDGGL